MSSHFVLQSAASRQSGVAKVNVIVGGSFKSIVNDRESRSGGLDLVFDAPAELARIADKKVDGLHLFPLGQGHTAITLTANASESIRNCLRELPGTSLREGLAARRTMGAVAAEELVKSQDFRAFLDELTLTLLAHYGKLTHVSINGKAGLAGGTGSAAVLILVDAIREVLLRKTDSVVSVNFDLIGAITSAGLGRSMPKNAAAGIVAALGYVSDANHDPRECRSALFRELPAVGADRVQRDSYVLQMEQAITADEVREVIDRRAPNKGLDNRFGNLGTLRADFYRNLDPRFDVAADAASDFAADLRDLAQTGSDHSVEVIQYVERCRDLPQEEIDDIVGRAFQSDPDELRAAAKRAAFEVSYQVRAVLSTGVALDLSSAGTVFSQPPTSVLETRNRLAVQLAALNALSMQTAESTDRCHELTSEEARLNGRLSAAIDRLYPKSLFQRTWSALQSDDSRLDSLAESIRAYRSNMNELVEVNARIAALEDAFRQVQDEHDFLLGKLQYLMQRLEPLVLRGDAERSHCFVNCVPLDDRFRMLWCVDDCTAEDALVRLLGTAVRTVTLHGMAKIVDAPTPRLDAIARQIANRCVATTSPFWGGKDRHDTPLTIHVLPPLDAAEAATLRQLIQQDDGDALVAVANSATASVNCIDLHYYTVESPSDLLTGFYAREYSELQDDPHRSLYMPSDVSGIDIRDGQIHFEQRNEDNHENHSA